MCEDNRRIGCSKIRREVCAGQPVLVIVYLRSVRGHLRANLNRPYEFKMFIEFKSLNECKPFL